MRTLSMDDLRETFLIRSELEGLAASLASTRITRAQLVRVKVAEAQFVALSDGVRRADGDRRDAIAAWAVANDDFHDAILDAAGVRLLAEVVRGIRRPFVAHLLSTWNDAISEILDGDIRQHRAIRELIEHGSATGARALMQEHIATSGALSEIAAERTQANQSPIRLLRRMNDPFYLRGGMPSQ